MQLRPPSIARPAAVLGARACAGALGLLLACCHAPITQLVIVVESDFAPGAIASVRIEVGEGAEPRTAEVRVPDDATLPFSFGVRGRGATGELAEVRLVAHDETETAIVQARARIPFVRGETRRVIVRLERACADRESTCAADALTCRAGACVDPAIPESQLTPVVPGDELLELPPFPAFDAGLEDAGTDAGPSCAPACNDDETCNGGRCRCGVGVSCGVAARCEDGACIPWPRSCDEAGRSRGCDVVELPAGVLTMGDEDASSYNASGAFPVQPSISVGALELDAYEVSVARFRRFWDAGHPAPEGPVSYPRGRTVEPGPVTEPKPNGDDPECNWSGAPGAREDHPINCVSFATALAFCVWDGGRLPTEAEWEWSARGHALGGLTPGRDHPWGDEVPEGAPAGGCDRAHLFECPGEDGGRTVPVGSFDGVVGLYDQIGNVGEWTADHYDLYGDGIGDGCWRDVALLDPLCRLTPAPVEGHTVRGASWVTTSYRAMYGAARFAVNDDDLYPGIGLRCARAAR